MNTLFSVYSADTFWILEEHDWDWNRQNVRESQFALGNGFIGTRSALEEIPAGSRPGTYLAGVFDRAGAQVTDLVNFPNPFRVIFTIDGEKLGPGTMELCEQYRVLNLKKGVLVRSSVFRDRANRRYRYESLRFLSMNSKSILVHRVILTPMDGACRVDVRVGTTPSAVNRGPQCEGEKQHFRIREIDQTHHDRFMALETLEKKKAVTYWNRLYLDTGGRKKTLADTSFSLDLRKNQSAALTRITDIRHFPRKNTISDIKLESQNGFNKAVKKGYNRLLANHERAWEKLWNHADVVLDGDSEMQLSLRFSIYHMLICGQADDGFSSIGAKSLSGEGYRGHVFWDTEIFLFPFFVYTFPEVARSMLLYRYHRLEAARELAVKEGYQGAKFPWESADTGLEETPSWGKREDGSVSLIHTHEFEHHITADIAYAAWQYWQVTGDERFWLDYGCRIMFETARFWASRVEWNESKERFDINHVIGPDEYHVDVNNNAFTNVMAAWNLEKAAGLYTRLKEQGVLPPALVKKMKLTAGEIECWLNIARKLSREIGKKGIIEQFEGYFKLKDVILDQVGQNGLPLIPSKISTMNWEETTLLKQADVVMLLCLLNDEFDAGTKKANFDYYALRTTHESSLSPAMHAVMASRVGQEDNAYTFFKAAARMDIDDVNGNTADGIHSACLGGVWQAVVFGFFGISVVSDMLSIDPVVPEPIKGLRLNLVWKEYEMEISAANESVAIIVSSSGRPELSLMVFSRNVRVKPGKRHVFVRK